MKDDYAQYYYEGQELFIISEVDTSYIIIRLVQPDHKVYYMRNA